MAQSNIILFLQQPHKCLFFQIIIISHSHLTNFYPSLKVQTDMLYLQKLQHHTTFQRICFHFCSKELASISKTAQRALWADSIIKEVMNSVLQPYSPNQPISQRIQKLENPSKKYQFDQSQKEIVFSLFKGGTVLDADIYRHQQIRLGKENPDIDHHATSPFIFFPSYVATQPIFKHLVTNRKNNVLIEGGKGTGKTVSSILFVLLTNFINSFVYKSTVDSELKKQYLSLKSQNFFKMKIHKYFYWSVDPKEDLKKGQLQRRILRQATELSEDKIQQLQEITEFSDFVDKLKDLYPRELQPKFIVDEVNILCSLMRNWNYSSKENIYEQTFKIPAQELYKKLLVLQQTGFVLNSTNKIQDRLLQPAANADQLRLDLQSEDKMKRLYINHLNAAYDFQVILWFELERNLRKMQASQQKIKKMQQNYSDIISYPKIMITPYFKTHRNARKFFHESEKYLKDILRNKIHLGRIFKSFQQFCFWDYIQQLNDVVRKDFFDNKQMSYMQFTLVTMIYQMAQQKIGQIVNRGDLQSLHEFFQIQKQFFDIKKPGQDSLSTNLIEKDILQGVLPFRLLEAKNNKILIQFLFSVKDCSDILPRTVFDEHIVYHSECQKQDFFDRCKVNNFLKMKMRK